MIIDGMSNIQDKIIIIILVRIIGDTIIIDDMSNIMNMVFISGRHKHVEWWSLVICQTIRTRYLTLKDTNLNKDDYRS